MTGAAAAWIATLPDTAFPQTKQRLGIVKNKLFYIQVEKKDNPKWKTDAIKKWDKKTKNEKLEILDKRINQWKIADRIPILRAIQNLLMDRDRKIVQQSIKKLEKERKKVTKPPKVSKFKKYWK